MPLTTFRDESIIVIHIGSYRTRAILGISESLTPPTIKIFTRVGIRKAENHETIDKNNKKSYLVGLDLDKALEAKEDVEVIWPIKQGIVKDWEALKAIWSEQMNRQYPPQPRTSINPVYLIVPPQWNMRDKELATCTFFEDHLVAGFAIGDASVFPLYAMGHLSGIVIHVGYEKTDITPVLDAQAVTSARITIPIGGKNLTERLHALLLSSPPILKETNTPLPSEEITFELAEKIKCSNIVEVILQKPQESFQKLLNKTSDNLPPPDSSMEGVEDVASIVVSGRTREYLAQKEAEKNQNRKSKNENNVFENKKLTYNQFTLDNSQVVLIGKERFEVCDNFFEDDVQEGRLGILNAIYMAINSVSIEPDRRSDLWENIAIVGEGSRILGFKEQLLSDITQKYISVIESTAMKHPNMSTSAYTSSNTMISNVNSSYLVYHNPPIIFPSTIRLAKIPDFFLEWKLDRNPNAILEEACFLGGQIVAKLSFNDPSSKNYMGRGEYNENGPTYINEI
ncbi:uncharacterized protein T551_03199 [Pneumocystis jirovecii RU7]|uniref:Actin-like ATPase domain-containing protein n=1 Tax=Pneumocystis jirovecii (strain RU7) TaxID=1408657 RepID=A0A0W4ZFR0_PNEJ7|nr:uncharacterized protein T551_03199 [Pneumocystis jirovecii RU7]KTW27205.1 hypothetical protein T551_03199 [Pneumocystis jirovecii RU7]